MAFHLVSYATAKYRHRQIFLAASAKANGIVESVRSWTPSSIASSEFPKLAPDIHLSERGSGFWAWKPFIIQQALESLPDGEIVFYCDAGRKYPYILLDTPLDAFVPWMDENHQDIMPGISIPWSGPMSMWTKYDAFAGTGIDSESIRKAAPIQASFSFWRNSPQTRNFLDEWLSWCCQRSLISDDPSTGVKIESSDFKGHRHDQSLLNLCCHKHGIHGLNIGLSEPDWNTRDPSQVIKQVFGAKANCKPWGKAAALAAIPLQATEKAIRRWVSMGKTYE